MKFKVVGNQKLPIWVMALPQICIWLLRKMAPKFITMTVVKIEKTGPPLFCQFLFFDRITVKTKNLTPFYKIQFFKIDKTQF